MEANRGDELQLGRVAAGDASRPEARLEKRMDRGGETG